MELKQIAHAFDIDMNATSEKTIAKIRIGGNDAALGGKFVPNINASKWNDEFWMNFNLPDAITNEVESKDGEKVNLLLTNYQLSFYQKNDKEIEWEFVFDKKPEVNTIIINLLYSEGLNFYYQPPLTQAEIDTGAKRPENVVGSYAIYANKRNNKYQTGKFGHIYYPYLTDADNNRVRAESFAIADGKMTITLPDEWLKNAKYPVILDPNLGYDTVGGSSNSAGTTWVYTAPEDSTDTSGGYTGSYHFAFVQEWSPTTVKAAVYAASGGYPSGNVVDTATGNAAISDDCNFPAQGNALAASTSYFVCFITSTDWLVDYKLDAGAGGRDKSGTTYAGEFTNPAGTYGSRSELISAWVDYTSGAQPGISVQTIG